MTTCERFWCDRPAVWALPSETGYTAGWCNKHAVRVSDYRERAWLPAGSPQLRLSEVDTE